VATVNLGDKVRDQLSGLTGIVVSRTEWMYGCVRCGVQPQELKDGKPVESTVFDEPQLEIVQRGALPNVKHWREPERVTAGARDDVKRRPDPEGVR